MEWPNNLVIEFLTLYEEEEVIWNPKHPDHKNKMNVAEAWENIRRELSQDITIVDLKKKKEGLMATYRSLNHKIQQSKKSSMPGDETYKPSWFCFDQMHKFLKDIYNRRAVIDNESFDVEWLPNNQESDSLLDEVSNNSECQPFVTIENLEDERFKQPPRKETASNRYSVNENVIEKQMNEAYSILKQAAQKRPHGKDELDLYGELFISNLRKLDEETRDIVMNDVDNLMFRAKRSRIRRRPYQSVYSTNLPSPQSSISQSIHGPSFLPENSYYSQKSPRRSQATSNEEYESKIEIVLNGQQR